MDSFSLPAGFTGQSLKDLGWGRRFGVNVIKLVHGKRRKNMPAGNTALAAGDTIYVVGERENLRTLRLSLGLEESADAPTLRESISAPRARRRAACIPTRCTLIRATPLTGAA